MDAFQNRQPAEADRPADGDTAWMEEGAWAEVSFQWKNQLISYQEILICHQES